MDPDRAAGSGSRGLFVVLEGIDGAGKSLQARQLADALRDRGLRVVLTREPTDGAFGRRYRAWARGEIEAGAEEILEVFLRDRDEHVADTIEPALRSGAIVVCDRYLASTRAYQRAAGIDADVLERSVAEHPVPVPDVTLWLRLPVPDAMRRLGAERERFERAEFLERVDAEYARLALLEIDARPAIEDVQRAIWARVEPLVLALREATQA